VLDVGLVNWGRRGNHFLRSRHSADVKIDLAVVDL